MNIDLNMMKSSEDWLRLFVQIGDEARHLLKNAPQDAISWRELDTRFFESAFPPIPTASQTDYRRWTHALAAFAQNAGVATPSAMTFQNAEAFARTLVARGISPRRRFRFYRRVWRTVGLDAKIWNTPNSVAHGVTEHYRRLSPSEIKALVIAADARDPDAADMIRLGYWTGLRLSDIAELDRTEVRTDIQALEIVPNKVRTRKPHPILIPLVDEPRTLVARRLSAAHGAQYLFPPDCRKRPSRRIKRLFDGAGVTKELNGRASFHSLRATFISLMDEAGVQPYITDAITGHSNGGMHARYTQPSLDSLRAAVARAIPPLGDPGRKPIAGSDMVSGPRNTGRDEKSELGPAKGHGNRGCETQTIEESRMAQHVMPTVFTRVQQGEAVRNHRPQRVSRVAPVGRQTVKPRV